MIAPTWNEKKRSWLYYRMKAIVEIWEDNNNIDPKSFISYTHCSGKGLEIFWDLEELGIVEY